MMILQAAINGSRNLSEHPVLPVTPQQIADDARQAIDAGAMEIHLHVRRSDGTESLAPEDVAQTLTLVRTACPAIPIGISTSAAIVPDTTKRYQLISQWSIIPDYVSVNIHEEGALDLIKLLLQHGIGIEAGLWHAEAAEKLVNSHFADDCLRLLIEPQDATLEAALANTQSIEALLNRVKNHRPRLLHGLDTTAWDLVREAVDRGYSTRVGLEDMLVLPDGTPTNNNGALITAAHQLIVLTRPKL
ncbi:MAG: hypothetical protein GFH27_549333n108 [Chloroflexi bacterium AL-W]|nr:hypothetical protein [Chloroflexi bacterium AL-N1]NOK70439.1 hypothetical protein [Chloroflexi bacterium AL-N10]NOK78202.1 hypothetical protein [Chloroflexi bacterium AL-N5]NOK85301.1 hypothetical protein [Chloroflexi bacterium AL-W]NOK92066.1 hypothetical protein [Chloroflexi bacterium AL-N15]